MYVHADYNSNDKTVGPALTDLVCHPTDLVHLNLQTIAAQESR